MSDNGDQDNNENSEVTTADHIHSFGSGAVLGGALGLVFDYTEKMEMSTVEGIGVALVAGLGVGIAERAAMDIAGIKFKEQFMTNVVGIGVGSAATIFLTGGFEEAAEDTFSALEPAGYIETVQADATQGTPIAISGDDLIYGTA